MTVRLKPAFEIVLLPDAVEFLDRLDVKTKEKIYHNAKKSQYISDHELFKKLNEHICEFRTLYGGKL
jgi:hypothetical protein